MSKSSSESDQTSLLECIQSNKFLLQQMLQQKLSDAHRTELGGMVHPLSVKLTKELLSTAPAPLVELPVPPISSSSASL